MDVAARGAGNGGRAMRWKGRRGSSNIEDLRRASGGRGGGVRAGGIGGVGLIAVLLIGWFFGVDVTPLLQGQGGLPPGATMGGAEVTAADEERAGFVSVALADTEEVWAAVFREQVGQPYQPPVLRLFKGAVQSGCGAAEAASGPFYCPSDRKVYLDTDFFVTMQRQLGAEGNFPAAYVVAHEVAHSIQDQLGILGQVNAQRARVSPADSNALSVRVELQADCLAGLWAGRAEATIGQLEPGDIRRATDTAAAIGDDALQRAAGQRPVPDSFTHGTAEQRAGWFTTGYREGTIEACNTFDAERL